MNGERKCRGTPLVNLDRVGAPQQACNLDRSDSPGFRHKARRALRRRQLLFKCIPIPVMACRNSAYQLPKIVPEFLIADKVKSVKVARGQNFRLLRMQTPQRHEDGFVGYLFGRIREVGFAWPNCFVPP
jgi:hypothetical protein